MVHIHGLEALFTDIRPPQCIMTHHGYGYYNHIIYCILCYPIVIVTSHSTVIDSFSLVIHISDKLLRSLDTIICIVAIHWKYYTHGLPLKLEMVHDGLFRCEWYLIMHTDLNRFCITKYGSSLLYLRGYFVSSVPKQSPWKYWFILVRKDEILRFQLIPL